MIGKEGKKNRKYGRGIRKPSHMRYNSELRWFKNKAKRIWKFMRKNPNWRPNFPEMDDEVIIRIKRLRGQVAKGPIK